MEEAPTETAVGLNPIPSTSQAPSDSDSESDSDDSNAGSSSKAPKRRMNSKLSLHLKGLMGEANLRYARGELETAKRMCFEVIRQAPDAYEPFLTLAQMYETVNIKKYRGFLMLACHLTPMNVSIWCRLAEVNISENYLGEAISCYSRALKAEPKNIELHQKRIELLVQKGDTKKALYCRQKLANKLPRKQSDVIIKISMDVARHYFELKKYNRAIEALNVPFKRVSDKITQDLLNMMLELLLASHKYIECLDYFTQYCGFTFDLYVNEDKSVHVNSYEIPAPLQVDLRIKFIVCIIKLQAKHLIPPLVDSMLVDDDVELVGDLYLDVVEALMSTNYPNEALKLLIPLVKSKNYSLAAVWLKHAECLNACEMFDESIEAYFTVMSLAPQHVEVLYPLAMLLLKQNKREEALNVLTQDLSSNKIDVAVLIEQMKLLKQIGDFDSYWKCAELMLSRHCIVLKYPEELRIVMTKDSPRERANRIGKLRLFRNDSSDVWMELESIREPTVEEEYKIFQDILQEAQDHREYTKMQKFAFMGLTSKKFQKQFDEMYIFTFIACIYNKDFFHGYIIIRDILVHHLQSNLAWNWFTLILQTPEDVRHTRFLERYQELFSAPGLIDANYNVSVGNYTPSLTYFMKEYRSQKATYSLFMIGVVILQLHVQRNFDKRKRKGLAELVTYFFITYVKQRSKAARHEAYYNLGRMYHQLGVNYLAELYYKKVLNFRNDYIDEHPEILSLREEAAFNLHLIYRSSGNIEAARKVLVENICV